MIWIHNFFGCFRNSMKFISLYIDLWCSFLVFLNFFFTVCYYHVMYAFQSESTLCNCLNAKELLARKRRDIWSLSDSNGIRTNNHLVHKRTLNHSAKLIWPSGWVSVYKLSSLGSNLVVFTVCIKEFFFDVRVIGCNKRNDIFISLGVWCWTYNHFHNILRRFDVLTNFPFTSSETMCDYYL